MPLSRSTGRPLRALVIDDEHVLAESLADSLRKLGLQVDGIAHDRNQANAFLAREGAFDIAFIDLYLDREYSGLELARQAALQQVAVVLVTGQLSDAISDTLATLRSAALLTKPYSVDQLRSVLAAVRETLPASRA